MVFVKSNYFILNGHFLDLLSGVSYEQDPDVSRIMEEQHNAAINLLRYLENGLWFKNLIS